MKKYLAVITLVVYGVVGEAPYAPSGWKPNGPAFELPNRNQGQGPQNPNYLPPVDPRNPKLSPGFDVDDVSVQGLPAKEQEPQFQYSPVSGQEYVGPKVNADVQRLNYENRQAQTQQQIFSEIARQRQLYSAPTQVPRATSSQSPTQTVPRQFISRTTPSANAEPTTTTEDPTKVATEQLNTGEVLNDDDQTSPSKLRQVTVEVTKQNIQEYPPEIFLNPLAQIRLQANYPGQPFGQLIYQPAIPQVNQKQVAPAAFDAPINLAALQSILAQRQSANQQQGVIQNQQAFIQNQPILAPESSGFVVLPQAGNQQLNQYQLAQPQGINYQLQPALLQAQPQLNQQYGQPNVEPVQTSLDNERDQEDDQQNAPDQPEYVGQIPPQQQPFLVQTQTYQPQEIQYQPQYQPQNAQNLYQNQAQILNYQPVLNQDLSQYYQNQQQLFLQQARQTQNNLQSGIDVNQSGNGLEQEEGSGDIDGEDEGNTATAVATAFGARTRPRVSTQYGAPIPNRDVEQATTESNVQDQSEASDDGVTIAQATAVANGGRRKSAKLRNRRVRPVFTLDKSGHLVLAQDQ